MEEELQDLYSKLKQNSSYTAELKKRFEENLKAMYRYQYLLKFSYLYLKSLFFFHLIFF